MPTVNLGRVKPIHRGTYNGATTYQPLDYVNYNGIEYHCIVTSTGNLPTDTGFFSPVVDVTSVTTALDSKANLSGADFTGPVTLSTAKIITDWNVITASGFYMAANAANAPAASVWFIGYCIVHNTDWVSQEVWRFSDNNESDNLRYRREKNSGSWGAWYRVYSTESEINSAATAKADLSGADFIGPVRSTAYFEVLGSAPYIQSYDTDGPTDKKYWRWVADGGNYKLENVNDAYNTVLMTPVIVDSSGNSILRGAVVVGGNGNSPLAMLDISAVDGANEGAEIKMRGAPNGSFDWNFDVFQSSFRLSTTDRNSGTSFVPRMTIDGNNGNTIFSGGRVGIGLSPEGPLDVNGAIVSRCDFNGYAFFASLGGATPFGANYSRFDIRVDPGPADVSLGCVNSGSGTPRALTFLAANQARLKLGVSGDALFTNSVGFGYGSGSGGSVTQPTSKATTVMINKPSGRITMNNAALSAGAAVAFAVLNSAVSAQDTVSLNVGNAVGGNYRVDVQEVVNGQFNVRITNITGGSLSEALELQFNIIKGSTT